jgi:hypothetical protein
MSSDSNSVPPPIPQILTHSVIPSLITNLDASDVIECYSLSRTVRLADFHNVTIVKMALGLRYAGGGGNNSNKRPLELTLEYGPQRTSSYLQDDSMPLVITDNHLSWANEANVYYTTASIRSFRWKSAYYMSSLTGAVLEKILEKAASYSTLKPRYQPFVVVATMPDNSDDKISQNDPHRQASRQILKSSSSIDFCLQMWTDMVDLGVDLTPIVSPPTIVPRLHVMGRVRKISGYNDENDYIPQRAAHFYQSFSNCWKAIATGDYSYYETSMPSSSPSTPYPTTLNPTDFPSAVEPSAAPTVFSTTEVPSNMPSLRKDGNVSYLLQDKENLTDQDFGSFIPTTLNSTNDTKPKDNGTTTKKSGSSKGNLSRTKPINRKNKTSRFLKPDLQYRSRKLRDIQQIYTVKSTHRLLWKALDSISEFIFPHHRMNQNDEVESDDVFLGELAFHNLTTLPESNFSVTTIPSLAPTADTASEAEKAANEAHMAAQEAKNASTYESAEKAATAAEHAADAAQKAANAARWQKDMETMNSGDGALITQALQRCWTDPLYGLATGNSSTVAGYLYLDGNFYYQMNLIPPYLDVYESSMQIPLPESRVKPITTDDFVDWALAFCIVGLFLSGLFAFLQQFGLRFAFYNRQQFFFDPTGKNNEEEGDIGCDTSIARSRSSSIASSDTQGLGRGKDVVDTDDGIPLSMGGRRQISRNTHLLVTNSPTNSVERETFDQEGNIELVNMMSIFPLVEDQVNPSPLTQVPPRRFTRHPDLVDMPSLRSRSKVAKPVTLISLESRSSSGSY